MKNWSYRKLTWEPYGSSAIWVRRLKSESKEEKRKREGENAERRERNKEMKFAGILGVNAQHTHTHVDLSVNFLTSTVQFVWLKTTLIFILYALCLTLFFFSLLFCRFNLVLVYCCCCAVGDCKSMTNVRWSSCLCKQTRASANWDI